MQLPSPPLRSLDAFIQQLNKASQAAPDTLPERMVEALQHCPDAQTLLTASQRLGHCDTYQRHLIHAAPDGRLCAVAIVWQPGQQTPVHGHFTWCAYRVIQGTMQEELFDWHDEHQSAAPHHSQIRRPGYATGSHAGMESTHRLRNAGNEVAISVHVYGVDAAQVCTHVNRIAAVEPAMAL